MASVGDAAGIGQKEIQTDWPVESGDTLGTTKIEGKQTNLVPEEGSLVPRRFKKGLGNGY